MIGGVLSLHDFNYMRKIVAFFFISFFGAAVGRAMSFARGSLIFFLVVETLSTSQFLILWTTMNLFPGRWPDTFSRGSAPLSRLANYYPERFHALVFVSVSYTEPGVVRDIGM